LYNNTPNNAIVNAASDISHRLLLKTDVFAVLYMNELKNLTNIVIGKFGKLVHKQNCSHDFFLKLFTSSLDKLDTLLLKQRKQPPPEYSCRKRSSLHLSTHAEKEAAFT
jgi:hypothetical protein